MSQNPVQSPAGYSNHQRPQSSTVQGSPTIGRAQVDSSQPAGPSSPTSTGSLATGALRSQRKPAPSPLQTSSAISPSSSVSPTQPNFPSPAHRRPSIPQIVKTSPERLPSAEHWSDGHLEVEKTYYNSDSSGSASPQGRPPKSGRPPSFSPHLPNEYRSTSDSIVNEKPRNRPTHSATFPTMAGVSAAQAVEARAGVLRTSSIDSAMGALASSGPDSQKRQLESSSSTPDIPSLIKSAGSPEAVIQYLLKEKHSQSQQNAQLWRLVDKQRAMILGLNKDLERALKEKEKYRKKLKEVLSSQDAPPVPMIPGASTLIPRVDVEGPKEQVLDAPASPIDSDSQKQSPIDVNLAPYPITPPADRIAAAPSSAVGEMLDPSHAMPKPHEHALDKFDHEAQERDAEAARKKSDAAKELPLHFSLPPSRSLPSDPPRMPPPRLPTSDLSTDTTIEDGIAQFPPPPGAPPPRKPPPAPLKLKDARASPTLPLDEDFLESDSDYDDLLEVTDIPKSENRGRRRTREDDDREREIRAEQEAELRSLSKKSKQSSCQAPKIVEPLPADEDVPVSPRTLPAQTMMGSDTGPASLAGMLSGNERQIRVPASLTSGLPMSPRPMGGFPKSALQSPPLSPRAASGFPPAPLSPRPPRQPIPLPLNTLQPQASPNHSTVSERPASPKPLSIVKRLQEAEENLPSPTKRSLDSPGERRVFRGFINEDYPDLLLTPIALPQIDIRVASSRMKPSRASLMSLTQLEEDPVFTLAVISRVDKSELWRVEKDSPSLAKLDQRLKQCSTFKARTPDRSLFIGHSPAKLDARRVALDIYFDELLNTQLDIATAMELCKYFSHQVLPPYADETGSGTATPDSGTPRSGPGGRPFKHGYLTKRGKNFGGWKARFFVLEGPHLKYYETPGGAHLGTIKLPNAQIGKQQQNGDNSSPMPGQAPSEDFDNQYRHAFLILEPKKKDPSAITKHVLCAESDRERDQWVEALLQWIDYQEDEDEDPKKSHSFRRVGTGDSSQSSGSKGKKKTIVKGLQHLASASSDTLVGVSYDNTRSGDAPSKPRHEHEGSLNITSSSGSIIISAPKDLQVLSDSASWTNKIGTLAPPIAPEEKKARKRSFFGFGTKTRSSTEGQESLFGSDSSSMVGGQSEPKAHHPVFGASLGDAVRYNPPTDVRVPLPSVVYRCIQYLDAKGAVSEEGIFRLSGSNVVIKALKERFNTEGDVNLIADEAYHDIHAVASLLKLYLRELPTTILTRDLHLEFLTVTELTDHKEKIAGLGELVKRLPQANATLLKYLIAFLIKIINNADKNKMTVRNVGIVFSPTLNIPAPVFALFLQNYEGIFRIQPEEYELPSPVEDIEHERHPSEPQIRRPSTSAASDSSHHQRLMEAVGENVRNTSTPPPMILNQLNQARSSPTPPPQRQTGYEPQYLAQQNGSAGRPAYESIPGAPAAPDPSQANGSQRLQAGYDKPNYEQGLAPSYDPSYGSRSSRRESVMFMSGPSGNLSHQGSKSRLREESHY